MHFIVYNIMHVPVALQSVVKYFDIISFQVCMFLYFLSQVTVGRVLIASIY